MIKNDAINVLITLNMSIYTVCYNEKSFYKLIAIYYTIYRELS